MGKTTPLPSIPLLVLRCSFCAVELRSETETDILRSADTMGWDWWTGYLPTTQYACPTCLTGRPDAIAASRARAQEVPRG